MIGFSLAMIREDFSMGDFGVKVSKPGQDVKTADDKDLLYTSKDTTLKIDRALSIKRTTNGAGVGDFAHSYGYKPIFFSFSKSAGVWRNDRWYDTATETDNTTINFQGGAAQDYRVFVFVDDTTV